LSRATIRYLTARYLNTPSIKSKPGFGLDISYYLAILPSIQVTDGTIMNAKARRQFEARARVIKAMAHPTRLYIIDELARQERCVRDLRDGVGADISTVSKHLSVLKEAGIIEDEKRGQQVWYCLKVPCILNFFGCVESVLKSNAKQLAEAVRR
jgi:ArsR family transcriptional regulator